MKRLLVLAASLMVGCGSSDPPKNISKGAPIELTVGGKTVAFANASARIDEITFSVVSETQDAVKFIVGFLGRVTDASDLDGQTVRYDHVKHNPDGYFDDDLELTFFYVGKTYYQPADASLTISSISDKEVTVDLSGTWFEFPSDYPEGDENMQGDEVEVTASFTVPLHWETE